jgi:hypothetical protein
MMPRIEKKRTIDIHIGNLEYLAPSTKYNLRSEILNFWMVTVNTPSFLHRMSEKTYFGRLLDEKEKDGHKLISYQISKIAYS